LLHFLHKLQTTASKEHTPGSGWPQSCQTTECDVQCDVLMTSTNTVQFLFLFPLVQKS